MPDTSDKAIGRRLIAVREARGYLQGFMVQMLAVTQQRWSLYENGHRTLPHDLLYKFCHITGAPTDFILFGKVTGMPMDLVKAMTDKGYDFNEGADPGAKVG